MNPLNSKFAVAGQFTTQIVQYTGRRNEDLPAEMIPIKFNFHLPRDYFRLP